MSQADNLAALATNVNSSGVLQPAGGGTGTSTSTGTGSAVLSNSPTLVTPTLGSASATQLATGLGSAGAPALTFTGDTNTGIFSPTADTIAFSEGGTESMRIDSSGNVGIGTSSPSGRLHVTGGNTYLDGERVFIGGSSNNAVINNIASVRINIDSDNSGTGESFAVGHNQTSIDNNNILFLVNDSGNVGIGTTSPAFGAGSGVELVRSGTATYRATSNGQGVEYRNNAGTAEIDTRGAFPIVLLTNQTERMRIDSSGNLLVGTTTSAGNLTVRSGGTNSGSLSLSAASGGGGASYLIMGNGDSGGASGPNVIVSANRNLQFGFGTSFSSTSGGTFTEAMRIDSSSNLLFNSGYGSVATAYGCRAWVNFNGTGTVAIRASGNVSSITDNGSGDYTVNFATALPDANYSISGAAMYPSSVNSHFVSYGDSNGASGTLPTTSAFRFRTMYAVSATNAQDCQYVTIMVIR